MEEVKIDGKTLICKECGKEFFITKEQMYFFVSNGLSIPKRCIECRNARRDANKLILTNDLKGKLICRTKATWCGDRSYMEKSHPLRFLGIENDHIVFTRSGFLYEGRTCTLNCRDWNDGYWKIVEEVKK